jgi:glycerol-3-phosphate dehydrogenase
MRTNNQRVIIIGAGSIGAALAHDLTLRGFLVTVVERDEPLTGVTGRHHGVLHCGARYSVCDPTVAKQCIEELSILRKIAPESVPNHIALYLAVSERDASYSLLFIERCREIGIPISELSIAQAIEFEPLINPLTKIAVAVPDLSIEPDELPRRFLNSALSRGASLSKFSEVMSFLVREGAIYGLSVQHRDRKPQHLYSDIVVNAAGPWAKSVCELAGISLPIVIVAGILYSISEKVSSRIVSRLDFPGLGDTIVPRNNSSIIGSNSWASDEVLPTFIPNEFVEDIRNRASRLIPACKNIVPNRVWAASRSLFGDNIDVSGRTLSRNFQIIDHSRDGLKGFFTIIGGKATTARLVAEAAGNSVCQYAGIPAVCLTRNVPLYPASPLLR